MGAFGQALAALLELAEVGFALVGVGGDGGAPLVRRLASTMPEARGRIELSFMNVAVLGAGGGGLAVAYEWASQGHRVLLYAQRAHDHHLAPVRERGGIQAEGVLEGFVPLETVTSDIAEAVDGVAILMSRRENTIPASPRRRRPGPYGLAGQVVEKFRAF